MPGSGPGSSAWPRKPAASSMTRSPPASRRGLGLGQAVAAHLAERRPAHADVSLRARAAASIFRSPCTSASAPTSFTCIRRRRAKRSAPAACATSGTSRRLSPTRRRRVPQLRLRGAAARSVPESRGARPQPRHLARRPDDGEPRLRRGCIGPRPTSSAARSPASARATRSPDTTRSDPAARGRVVARAWAAVELEGELSWQRIERRT